MATNLDQVVNALTAMNVVGTATTFFDIGQVPAATKWLIHSNLLVRPSTGTTPGNIGTLQFWWTTSADVKMHQLFVSALPAVWADGEMAPFNTFIMKNQEKIRLQVDHTGNANVDLQTLVSAIVIT